MATGLRMIMSSTRRPTNFTAMAVPPMTLALPGVVTPLVTPQRIARWSCSSKGLKESMILRCGVRGSVFSLWSLWEPMARGVLPVWQWASTRPGVRSLPPASRVSTPSGASAVGPTARILPASIRIWPPGISGPDMGLMYAF